MLAFVLGAAAALLLPAPALAGPPPLTPELAVPPTPGIQHSPAIAIDPAAPNRAVVAADDGNSAPPYPSSVTGTTADWTAGWAPGGVPPYAGSASAGQADVAWGADTSTGQNVYLVETGTNTSNSLCSGNAGILFSPSSDGGATYDTPIPVDTGSSTTELVEPAIAVAGQNITIVYTELKWLGGCGGNPGTPDSASILMTSSNDGGNSWTSPRRVSPLATAGIYRSPAVAQLLDQRVIVAFRDDSASGPQIETETCSPFSSPALTYCGAGPGLVGPSTVVGDATAPALASEIVGPPTPSVVAAGGRVVVAWSASVDANVRAFAAMSTDNGVTYGPATQIDPNGPGNQVAPELAATATGRVDVAYLWDSGLGGVQATAVSANPPFPGATTEAWAQPIVVQGAVAGSATPIAGQLAPLGRRIGVATADVPALSPLPATVVAFTDTTSGQDIHVVGLKHGLTAPVVPPQTLTASKNLTTILQVGGTDDDGDPLTWSVGAGPSNAASTVRVSDAARGQFSFTAANVVDTETFVAVATDGVPGHEVSATITVNVVNDPPKINCTLLFANEDTPLEIPPSCVTDPNNDPLTVTLDTPTHGTVERVSGNWFFIPATHSTAQGSFMLHATDGDKTADGLVIVTVSPPVGKVTLTVKEAKRKHSLAAGLALRLEGHAVDAQGHAVPVTWNFGDKTPSVTGSAVAHRFRNAGAFTVRASASTATPVQVHVLVRRRAVELPEPPRMANGVLSVIVRTRVAGQLTLRVDSRSEAISVPAGTTRHMLRIQVTTGPLVRLSLRLRPSKSTLLPVLSVQRMVLVPAPSAA